MTTDQLIEQCAALIPSLQWDAYDAPESVRRYLAGPRCAALGLYDLIFGLRVEVESMPGGGYAVALTYAIDDGCWGVSIAASSRAPTLRDAYAEASRAYARACAAERPAAPEMQP